MRIGFLSTLFACLSLVRSCAARKIRNQGTAYVLTGGNSSQHSILHDPSFLITGARDESRSLQAQCDAAKSLRSTLLIDIRGNLLSDSAAVQVGQTIANIYNTMVQTSSCAAGQRKVNLVQTTNAKFFIEDERLFAIEFTLEAPSCVGCKASPTLLSYFDGSVDNCPCQGPQMPAFEDEIDNALKDLYGLDLRGIVELQDVSTCPDLVEFTSSYVLLELKACASSNLDDAVLLDSIAERFVQDYNRRNNLNSKFCDPFFREIVKATATLVVDHIPLSIRRTKNRRGLGSDGSNSGSGGGDDDDDNDSGEQDLSGSNSGSNSGSGTGSNGGSGGDEDNAYEEWSDEDDSTENGNGAYVADPAEGNTEGSSTGSGGGSTLTSVGTLRSFDSCTTKTFQVRLDTVARCRGCNTNTITLFDEAVAVNSFSGFNDDDSGEDDRLLVALETDTARNLQQSACRCPIKPSYRAVTEEEMKETLEESIQAISTGFRLDVQQVIEIERVQCDPMTNGFATDLEMEIVTDSPDTSLAAVEMISSKFVESYNALSQRFCDPFFREPQYVELLQVRRRRLRGRPVKPGGKAPFTVNFVFSFKILVNGICRSCPQKTSLFADAFRRRQRSLADAATSGDPDFLDRSTRDTDKHRRLQNGGECFCAAVNPQEGVPTEREFIEQFDQDLASLQAILGNNFAVNNLTDHTAALAQPPRGRICSLASECIASNQGDVCVNNYCLNNGNPRFTLTWTGDDDLDLFVLTPDKTELWYDNAFDPVTRGAFDTNYVQTVFGNHVESVYFPEGQIAGIFEYYVVPYDVRGGSDDQWKVQIFENDVLKRTVTGSGSSGMIRYGFPFPF